MNINQSVPSNDQPDATLPPLAGDANTTSAQPPLQPASNAQTSSPTDDPVVQSMLVALPVEAQDTDLIEKEWVEKAKQIVDRTNDDPFIQQQELSKMKADYMKKRYNKDIKLSDE